MSTAAPKVRRLRLGPRSAGMLLTRKEFDRARGQEGWRYELINGVLIVSPTPAPEERHPNDRLGQWLWNYRDQQPQGTSHDSTLPEQEIQTKKNRRRVDRAIWAGLGREPEESDIPTIVIELVSKGKVNQERDYVAKQAEYREIGVKQYWVVDRFRALLDRLYLRVARRTRNTSHPGGPEIRPALAPPASSLDVARLLAFADLWARKRLLSKTQSTGHVGLIRR